MRNALLVGLGGFLGSSGRYAVGAVVHQLLPTTRFPMATLVVNVVGCFLIGLLGGLVESRHLLSADVRLFVFTGVLGGFTTFSAFAFETWFLGREHFTRVAILNVAAHVLIGLAVVALGVRVARMT